ncbi:MAG: peptide chain release factor 1 [Actinobacteria bacterium]|nr:MAG: peptide chain release factor 1 [Actinomycetota bacterium]
MDDTVAARLDEIEQVFEETERSLGDPEVLSDPEQLAELGKRHSDLKDVVADIRRWRAASADLVEAKAMSSDPDMAQLAKELAREIEQLEDSIKVALVPKDPNDSRDVLVEVRPGVGGDEAAIWAGDLTHMLLRYADRSGFKTEILEASPSEAGGYDRVTISVKGRGAYSRFKYEAGVHRVQRVPKTESQGRVHTSTATVAVLPEADEVEVELDLNDVKVDVYRSTGPGGQSVNTTDSAVRLTHEPTGLVVTCQDEKSQLQNKEKAFRILRARLYQIEVERQQAELAGARRDQVGTGGRSEKIRTYNYKDNRVTDHRIGLTIKRLDQILQGDLDEFVEALAADEQARLLAEGDPA